MNNRAKKSTEKKPALTLWDSADYLKTDADISAYLEACLDEAGDDAEFMAQARRTVASAKSLINSRFTPSP
jgi:DNA-binding phage protein